MRLQAKFNTAYLFIKSNMKSENQNSLKISFESVDAHGLKIQLEGLGGMRTLSQKRDKLPF